MDKQVPSRLRADLKRAKAATFRYSQNDDLNMLEEAIAIWERILQHPDFAPSSLGFRLSTLNHTGWNHLLHYWATEDIEDIERAIQIFQTASEQARPNSSDLAATLSNLGIAFTSRYEHTDELADLDQAIHIYRRLVEKTPLDSPDLPDRLNSLGITLVNRYGHVGDLPDLEQAIQSYQRAIQQALPGSPTLPDLLNNLADALEDRYDQTGNRADIDLAIEVCRQATELNSVDAPDISDHLDSLGSLLIKRFNQTGNLSDLDQAILIYRKLADQASPDSPDLLDYLNTLGARLGNRYEYTGKLADLDQAVRIYQQVVEQTPLDSPDLPGRLSNLGNIMSNHYDRTGDLADLECAIRACQQAIHLTSSGSPELPFCLTNLGNGLMDRYGHSGDLADLERAVQVFQQAVDHTPPDSPDLPARLTNLGNGLGNWYKETEDVSDLERSITMYAQAVERTPPHSRDLPIYLINLGIGLLDRYDRLNDSIDLDRGIQVYEQAVRQILPLSPHRSIALNNLGSALRKRYERDDNLTDRDRATRLYQQAAVDGLQAAAKVGLVSARSWMDWAFEWQAWEEVVHAYDYARQASEQLFRIQLVRRSKEIWLREVQGLPTRTAYALAKIGDSRGAVLALEHGRALLLSEALERDRADLEALQSVSPDLYADYQEVVGRIVYLEAMDSHSEGLSPGHDLASEIRKARTHLDTIVENIRHMSGYERFLTPPTFADVQSALTDSVTTEALIYLATTRAGTVALVVTDNAIETLWSDFTETELDTILIEYDGEETIGGYLYGQSAHPVLVEEALADALPRLGERVLAPFARHLRESHIEQVTLIPSGRLALLPLHAATYSVDGRETCFLDEFTISYAPNARTLAAAKRMAQRIGDEPCLVGAGNPLPHPNPLLATQAELEEVAAFFPDRARRAYYAGAATRDNVLRAIPEGTYLHFACHGRFDYDTPLDSHLELSSGDQLTLRDFLYGVAQPNNSRLVVLSACQSALSDFDNLPDEFIGLPTGFLQAGIPGVVGTLWPVDDLSTALIIVKFYELHLHGDEPTNPHSMPPAVALRKAQQWLRNLTNRELTEYLKAHPRLDEVRRQSLTHDPRETVSVQSAETALIDLQARPFADKPYHWAPFIFIGA